jgi:hypothetical protein
VLSAEPAFLDDLQAGKSNKPPKSNIDGKDNVIFIVYDNFMQYSGK